MTDQPDRAEARPVVHELRIAMTVDDYEGAVAFYRDALGLAERESWDRPDGRGIARFSGFLPGEARVAVSLPGAARARTALRLSRGENRAQLLVQFKVGHRSSPRLQAASCNPAL